MEAEEKGIIEENCPSCGEFFIGDVFWDAVDNPVVCEFCEESLLDLYLDSKMKVISAGDYVRSRLCFICNEVGGDKTLLNSVRYHSDCYEDLLFAHEKLFSDLRSERLQLDTLRNKALKYKGVVYRFVVPISGTESSDQESIDQAIQEREEVIDSPERRLELAITLIKKLYDFWPDYPPDWEERRTVVFERDNRRCAECPDQGISLDVDHIRKLSDGGSNRFDNLRLLCRGCHSHRHGGRPIGEYQGNAPVALHGKLMLFHEAMASAKSIHFFYRKFNGERSTRTIIPEEIMDYGQAKCVSGFCFLRKAKRTFNIKRMRNISIVQ